MKNVRRILTDVLYMENSVVSNSRNRCGNATWNHLKFTFTPEDAKRWPEIIYKTSSTCDEKTYGNPWFWCQGGPKTDQNCFEERSESDLGSKLVLGPPKSANASCTAHPFGYYLGDLGRRFGHRWAPRDPKIKRFGTRDAPKSENMTSRMRQQKKWNFKRTLSRKCQFLNVLNLPKCFI